MIHYGSMALQCAYTLAALHVPDLRGTIRRGGDDVRHVRGELGRDHAIAMPWDRPRWPVYGGEMSGRGSRCSLNQSDFFKRSISKHHQDPRKTR